MKDAVLLWIDGYQYFLSHVTEAVASHEQSCHRCLRIQQAFCYQGAGLIDLITVDKSSSQFLERSWRRLPLRDEG